jgi:hypothetical protein
MIADTMMVHGYKAYEYHVFNDNVIVQRVWISRTLQHRINREVNPFSIRRVENILKENRADYLMAMGISIDPITQLVESIENIGYVVKRIDYGLRTRANPAADRIIEENAGTIDSIIEMAVDPAIFTYHQRYRRMNFVEYQVTVLNFGEE